MTRLAQSEMPAAGRALPLFITQKNKYRVGILLAMMTGILYLTANHFHLFPPQFLPLWAIDRSVPFLPHSVWVYTSEYVFFVVIYLQCKNLINLNKYFYSFLALQTVSIVIFWLWPTTYPRHEFPLPDDLNVLTHALFTAVRTADTPANCCPSLHVSSVYLSAFIYLDDQREKFPFFFLWGTAIALSTLTTKQHYLIDVIAGLSMAIITYIIFHRAIDYRELRSHLPERGP